MVEPTGAEQLVDVEDLLVATTDGDGTIRQVDNAFVRVSGYTREQLVGAPHGILRHPMVPGGALHLMWQAVRAGDPYAAYVVDLAADGSRYGGFWTVTPLAGGDLLSVVSKPMVPDALELTLSVFQATADLEDQLVASGLDREEAAARGADQIAGMLADAGMGSMTDVAVGLLPAEVAALDDSLGDTVRRPGAGPLDEALGRLAAVRVELRDALSRLAGVSAALAAMVPDIAMVREQGDRVRALAARPGLVVPAPGVGRRSLPVPIAPAVGGGMDALLHLLEGDLNRIRRRAADAAFRGGLVLLHAHATAHVLAERLVDPSARVASLAVVPALCDAMGAGLSALDRLLQVTAAATQLAGARIAEAAGLLRAAADTDDPAGREILLAVATEVGTASAALARLAERAAECGRGAGPIDAGARAAVAAVRAAVLPD